MVAGLGLVALWAVIEAVKWVLGHWWVIIVAITATGVAAAATQLPRLHRIQTAGAAYPRLGIADADAASALQFEAMVSALLRRDGFAARLVGGGNDMAVDVIGTSADGNCVVAVQCKHTATGRKVAVPVLYQIFGTAAACYSASHQIVVTNGGFTAPARAWGRDPSHRVHLVDRALLAQWLAGRSILELIA
jgi:restriction system protein